MTASRCVGPFDCWLCQEGVSPVLVEDQNLFASHTSRRIDGTISPETGRAPECANTQTGLWPELDWSSG